MLRIQKKKTKFDKMGVVNQTIQRDLRTTFAWKQSLLVIIPLVTALLTLTVNVGWLTTSCVNVENSQQDQAFEILNYISLILSGLVLVATCIFLIRWQWAWYTTTSRRTGYDIEDIHPFILARRGQSLEKQSNRIMTDFNQDLNQAWAVLDQEV